LIDNAIAYGAPPVEVTTRRDDGNIVLDVADRGPGIAPDDVERLKQPFTRASAARTNAAGVAVRDWGSPSWTASRGSMGERSTSCRAKQVARWRG
jgi:signal transduction histidine kinase